MSFIPKIASDFVFTADMLYEDFAKYYGPLYVYKLTYRGTHSVLDHYEGYRKNIVLIFFCPTYRFVTWFFVLFYRKIGFFFLQTLQK